MLGVTRTSSLRPTPHAPVPRHDRQRSARRYAMRYGKDHKQATRRRIVEAAGRRFKQDGIDGAGVATVMSDAGLTNGAFYAHFESKEDLVANVLADQLRTQRQSFDAQQPRSGRTRSVHPLLPVPGAPRPVRRRLPVGRAARRDRPPPRRHQACLHRRADGHRQTTSRRASTRQTSTRLEPTRSRSSD